MPNPTPRTIEELKAWYAAHNLPPEEITRFFIGRDIKEPRAFGIYAEDGQFIVYKNKADGSREVRYHGPDEGYAVNELYLRLKQEIAAQKEKQPDRKTEPLTPQEKRAAGLLMALAALGAAALLFFGIRSALKEPNRGYYQYLDRWYYYNLSTENWYLYLDEWQPVTVERELQDHWQSYYVNRELTRDMGVTDISLTEFYSTTDSSSSWDSSDSWDSWDTDWDSDW